MANRYSLTLDHGVKAQMAMVSITQSLFTEPYYLVYCSDQHCLVSPKMGSSTDSVNLDPKAVFKSPESGGKVPGAE